MKSARNKHTGEKIKAEELWLLDDEYRPFNITTLVIRRVLCLSGQG